MRNTVHCIVIGVGLLVACGGDGGADDPDAGPRPDGARPDGGGDAMPAPACSGADATDDFERATLVNTWIQWVNAQCSIANGSDLAQAAANNWCYAVYATTFAADQFSEAVISTDKPASILTQVMVRQQPVGTPSGNGARYGFHYNADPGTARWEIKYDGVTSAATRIWMNPTAPAPVPGDRLRIEVRGSDPVLIRGLHNGVEIVAATDADPQRIATTGHSGLVERNAGSTTSPPNSPVWESWCGGDLP